jgi:hypothetical protein
VSVFLAAGSKQNRDRKDGDNHGDNDKWGINVHRAVSLPISSLTNPGTDEGIFPYRPIIARHP